MKFSRKKFRTFQEAWNPYIANMHHINTEKEKLRKIKHAC